jgi:Zn-dependent oligopeptidase
MYPVTAMIANITTPTLDHQGTGNPALMLHKDVVQFFHQMGYIFYNLLSHTQFSCNHASKVILDFREAPSHLIENWCGL